MQIIAKTEGGFLIVGEDEEVKEILKAAHGVIPEEIKIGQKIPAIDYSATLTKLRHLPDSYNYKTLMKEVGNLCKSMDDLDQVVKNSVEAFGSNEL